jgi:hypothetical protein
MRLISAGVGRYGRNGRQHFLGPWRNWLAHRTVDPGVAGSNPVGLALFARCQQMAAGDFFSRLLNSGRRSLDQRSSALGGVLAME